ncbi:type IV secretory system conjugative DNA transfer family protein [Bacillus badius]|uniref:type IV secretory system conjugative DNA transfer family protein n=1 Tax=Bacillus badius TaxID=1455 RepID=UPI0012E075D0|nr:TraM recognition domain-containing protein [Bacillus badius]
MGALNRNDSLMKPIRWGGSDCFTHMLIVGPTRCGKTATILKPIIYQLLKQKKMGRPLGLSVVEPKGDVAAMVAEMSQEMGLPYTHIDPTLPNTAKFNPMEGDINDVAEATVVVLKGLFGKQDAFFATVQELSARNVTKLLKELHGDEMDIIDVMNTLRDQFVLEAKVQELKARDGMTDLVHFFESELLGSMRDKYRQFVIGLRAQLENVVSNDALRKIMTGRSSINIDKHFEEGGILGVNTALGLLRSSGDAFGQFVIMHLQNGTFRRKGTERTRIPHYLIVDEYSRYINPDVEIFLSLAAEYRVAGIFATQSLGQLEIESGKVTAKAMKRSILANCRNKIAFGGIGAEDAKEFAEIFGKDKIIVRQSTYKNRIFLPNLFPDSYRDTEDEEYRFDPTDMVDGMPRFTFIHHLMKDGTQQKPALGKGVFVPRDWKERREWELEARKPDALSLLAHLKGRNRRKRTVAKQETGNMVGEVKGSIPQNQAEEGIQSQKMEKEETDMSTAMQRVEENWEKEHLDAHVQSGLVERALPSENDQRPSHLSKESRTKNQADQLKGTKSVKKEKLEEEQKESDNKDFKEKERRAKAVLRGKDGYWE